MPSVYFMICSIFSSISSRDVFGVETSGRRLRSFFVVMSMFWLMPRIVSNSFWALIPVCSSSFLSHGIGLRTSSCV
ncbi:hypothetical protein EV421DRAFT_1839032 [Armillaria borealis]|uniref:Uncharacterized protein n=1 Tax=Armillaria borealis TaxID=47425 RepID=A0AA39J376_9AGAR|nr:hypothetical protein EV421DRAFT_1839032 [Armillaria borealis]